MSELLSKVVKVRFTGSTYSAMALRAAAEKRTISDWVRMLVEGELGGGVAVEPESVILATMTDATGEASGSDGVSESESGDQETRSTEPLPVEAPEPVHSLATGGDDLSWLEGMQFDLGEG